MLRTIRNSTGSWLIKSILGIIVIVFIFWGVGSFRSQRLNILTKVNGEDILMESYSLAHANMLDRYKQMFGGQIPEGFLDRIDIKQQVLDGLINETLIRQAANEIGILVSDTEIQNIILSIPAFKHNGAFDQVLYERSLRGARLTPAVFEMQVRQQLLTDRLKALLGSGLAVTEAEARDHYMFENEEVNLSYISINASECETEVNATEQDLALWYESHSENYMTEPQTKLRYMAFKESDIDDVNATDLEIESYYKDHKNEYEVKERRRARHILLKISEGADEDSIEEIRKKAKKIRGQIEKGEDFAKLAKENSEDAGSAENGGELGFFSRGMMVKPFEEAVFLMKEGEVSKPVKTRFGWHIIELEEIEPGRVKSMTEVKNSIATRLKGQKAKNMIWDRANGAYDEIIQLGSLSAYAEQHEIELKTTELFSQKKPPAVIGGDPELLKTLFALNSGELSSLLQIHQGILIAEVLEKKAPYLPSLEEVKEQVKKDYVRKKAKELCRLKAKELLEEAKKQGLEAAAKDKGLKIQQTGLFKRTDRTAKGELSPAVVQSGLSLYEGKAYPDEVAESGNSFYVLALKEKKDADIAGFTTQKDAITKQILEQKQQTLFEDWLKHRWERASIKQVATI
ncbi:MAG: SurA N-terminal domain-containing protein [Deltaproteobacteria bacterium]|nr:SurA N-terminal domain-containing protein [Deltaproteobacteria bacterium]